MIVRPFCHVVIRVNITAAMSSGSQPPWNTLVRLATRNVASVPPKATAARTSCQVCQWKRVRATTSRSSVSMSRAPVTDTPYAVASRCEDWKVNISTSTAANIAALTSGR
jgi:hypothetical protein